MAEAAAEESFEFDMISELFGAIAEAPEKDHGRILKAFLLNGIDTMREHTAFQLDLLEKLAAIALNNVQDVRLYSLEARMKEIEQGKPVTFGAVMAELFFALAVEAAILVGVTAAAPVVAGAGALLLSNIKTAVRAPRRTHRIALTRRARSIVDEARADLARSEQRLLDQLQAPRQRGPNRAAERAAWRERKVADKATAAELAEIRRKIFHMDRNREFHVQELVAAQVPFETVAPQFQDLEAAKVGGKLAALIADYAHHVDAGKSGVRAFSLLALKQYPEAFAPPPPGGAADLTAAFTTTGALADITRECESLKLDVILHHAQLRAIVEAVDEDEVLEAFETILVLEEIENNLFDTIDLSETMLASLEAFVAPMELAVWLLYLEANNVLDREATPTRRTVAVGGYVAGARFIGDDFVVEVLRSTGTVADNPSTTYQGLRYSGLHVLDEHQAYYLFHRFAQPAFAQIADRVPKSAAKELGDFIHRDVAARAFDEVLSMQKVFFFSGENAERRDLVKEMGLVVIEFFNFVRQRVRDRDAFGFSDAVPEGTKIAALLDGIEKPELTEAPADAPPPTNFADWETAQVAAQQADWEERTLVVLDTLSGAYDRALDYYSHNLAMREKYRETFSVEMFDDLFFRQAETQLLSTRSAIEAQIATIEADEAHASDIVDARIEELQRKLFNAPVEREMPSVFGR
ncbi:hypothetical protein [Amaricoccus sp.]|uniref:hypothetical protein n=1 Tax=Amaricoccus sp. TaxID=1872485 RepID=UPI0026261E68|nr:hypothetical protein [Amaricoccus sp.]HRO10273.1 hypothetical protein [Amaricoccus sp.]